MPTTAKLAAAVIFGLLGWVCAQIYANQIAGSAPVGYMREITAVLGVIMGWRIAGSLAGHGYVDAIAQGLRTAVTLAFAALLLFSIVLMYDQTKVMAYDGPFEAIFGVFKFMLEHGLQMLNLRFLGVLLGGGMAGGMLTEWIGRRWR